MLSVKKQEDEYSISDVFVDDFVMFRYELNSIFRKHHFTDHDPSERFGGRHPLSNVYMSCMSIIFISYFEYRNWGLTGKRFAKWRKEKLHWHVSPSWNSKAVRYRHRQWVRYKVKSLWRQNNECCAIPKDI